MHKEWREVAEIWHEGKLVATVTGFHLKIQENSSEDVDVAWQAEIEKVQNEYPVSPSLAWAGRVEPCVTCNKRGVGKCAARVVGGCKIYDIWKEKNRSV